MEANCTDLTERILRLTLEIIYLLTGEDNIVAKKTLGDGPDPTTVPLCSLLSPERNNEKKILEVTKKITDLLMGEVFHPSYPELEGPNVNSVKVEYTNEEEEEDVRGNWPCNMEGIELEKETDGSSNGNPPERCLLHSWDSTQEDHTTPHHDQIGSRSNFNITIKKELKEDGVMKEYLDGHKDLYKDIMMKNQPPLTSPDGSSNGNPPCPRPLYSRDSTQEDHTIPHHHQSRSWSNFNINITKEIKQEEEESSVMEKYLDEHKDVMMENQPPLTSPDGSSNGNPPERCLRPLYSRDSTQEDHTTLHHHQAVEVIDMKIEVKEEDETYERGNQLSMKEGEMMGTIAREESSRDINTGRGDDWNISGGHLSLSRDCNENNGIAPYSPGVRQFTQYIHHKFDHLDRSTDSFSCEESKTFIPNIPPSCHSANGPLDPSNPGEPSNFVDTVTKRENEMLLSESVHNTINITKQYKVEILFPCSECGKGFKTKRDLQLHQFVHAGKEIYSCPDCKKKYMTHHGLMEHKKLHAGEKPYNCLKCEASFGLRSQLTAHQKVHYEQKPYSCSECRKSFVTNQELLLHKKAHTREKPFTCSECGKSFTDRAQLSRHHRVHTGEKPFICSVCGKCFSDKGNCDRHLKSHTSDRPHSCSECGKCFKLKGALTSHQKTHHPNIRFW